MSKASLEAMGIYNMHAKTAFMNMHFNQIKSEEHFENIIKYIKRKIVLFENSDIGFKLDNRQSIISKIRDLKSRPKHTPAEMAEFRAEYPQYNSWKSDCLKLRLSKAFSDTLQSMEDQRMKEDENMPLTKEDLKKLLPFKSFIEFIRDIRIKLAAHPSNSGYACILGGRASTYKTTICEILAQSFGPYHVWPGTQFVKEDILKYDSAARAAISTIVIEEMKWLSLTKRVTLNDTLCSIKEQLSGTGLNVRLAKNKTSIDDLILKIERFFISFNPDEYLDYQTLNQLIESKPEFKRRFYLYNMDRPELANLYGKPSRPWKDEYKSLASKLLRNPQNWESFCDLLEKQRVTDKEVESIMSSIKDYDSDVEAPTEFQFDSDTEDKPELVKKWIQDFPENQMGLPEYNEQFF